MAKRLTVAAAAMAVACSGTSPPEELPGTVTWCQALGVLEASCQRCHNNPVQDGAPFQLLTYEDTQQVYGTVVKKEVWEWMREWVSSDMMPPVNPATMLLTPPVEPLSCEQKTTLIRWLDEGAKSLGGVECAAADTTPVTCDPVLGGDAGTMGM